MKRTSNGWDERDDKLWSAICQLASYGIIAGDRDDRMISQKQVLALLEDAAEARYGETWKERCKREASYSR